MRIAYYFVVIISLLPMGGCCKEVSFIPERPAHVQGWTDYEDRGIHTIGEFVLKKGDLVDNGLFGVELVKIISPKRCYDPFAENVLIPHAMIRVFDASSKRTILEVEVGKSSTQRLINFGFPVAKYGIDSIHIREINTRDEWVWLELWK